VKFLTLTGNTSAPIVANHIPDQTVEIGEIFNFTIPDNTFIDSDEDHLVLTITQIDDSPLPSWLTIVQSSPSFVGRYDARISGFGSWTAHTTGIFVEGSYAYIVNDDEYIGLEALDISDPTNPKAAGGWCWGPSHASEISINGDYLYIADPTSCLYIIDISNRAFPSYVHSYSTYAIRGIFIKENLAYLADDTSGLKVINITDPEYPTLMGYYLTPDRALGIFVSDNYAYVAFCYSGLLIFNISDPTINPRLVNRYNTSECAKKIFVSGDYAYITNGSSSLLIINISNPCNISLIGSYNVSNCCGGDIFVSNKYIYITDSYSKLRIIDINDPTNPMLKGIYDAWDRADEITIKGNYIYMVGSAGLQIIEISSTSLSGIPMLRDYGTLNIKVTADDGNKGIISDSFNITTTLVWDETPTDQVTEYCDPFLYSLKILNNITLYYSINNTINFTIDTNGLLTKNVGLAIGIYFVQVNISDGIDIISIVISISVKDCTPKWDILPTNQNIEYGSPFSYSITASDLQPVIYFVNDTTNFQIDTNGLLTNKTFLVLKLYTIQLNASDGIHTTSAVITINVQDTTAPKWNVTPTDQIIEYGDPFIYSVKALDLRTIYYTVNDTINFVIDNNGFITNGSIIPMGVYTIQLNVTDNINIISNIIKITVQDTIAPIWNELPQDQNVEYGDLFVYNIKASDLRPITYFINDTTNFNINNNGMLMSKVFLTLKIYIIKINASDGIHATSAIIKINVQDTIAPKWDVMPQDKTIKLGQSFRYNIHASDLRPVIYGVSDFLNFAVDGIGTLTNNTILKAGPYYIQLSASDGINMNTTRIIILVIDPNAKVNLEAEAFSIKDIYLLLEIISGFVALALLLFILKKFKYQKINIVFVESTLLTLLDFITDIIFSFHLFFIPEFVLERFLAIGFILLPVLINAIMIIQNQKKLRENKDISKWIDLHFTIHTLISFLALSGLDAQLFLFAGLFIPVFDNKTKIKWERRLIIQGTITNVLEDIPQIILQTWVTLSSSSFSSYRIVAMMSTSLSIVFGVFKRSLIICTKNEEIPSNINTFI
jgi:hypothetical protein